MDEHICIYADEGAGAESLKNASAFFGGRNVTAEDILGGTLNDADMLVMPGGADKPYCHKLNGKGNTMIRDFVQRGGTYLGICAGAYYACKNIEFQKGEPGEICEPRELDFLDGTAYGDLREVAAPYDDTPASAEVTHITADGAPLPVFYWGGPAFKFEDDPDVNVHACYQSVKGNPPAIISLPYGKGRVILSGVHFEASPARLRKFESRSDQEKERMGHLAEKLEYGYEALSKFIRKVIKT